MKVLKIECPVRNRKNILCKGHLFFRAFISLASQIMKGNIVKILGQIHPFNSRFKFLQSLSKAWPLSRTEQIFQLPTTPNLHTPQIYMQMFWFPDLQKCINFNCGKYFITVPLWKGAFSKRCEELGYVYQNHRKASIKLKLKSLKLILSQCSISILHENVRKPLGFWRFQGL